MRKQHLLPVLLGTALLAMTSMAWGETLPAVTVTLDAPEGVVAVSNRQQVLTGASALLSVELPEGADSSLLDTSNATLSMTEGDGYYVSEFVDPVVALSAEGWTEGTYLFAFDEENVAKLFTRATQRGSESEIYSEGGPGWSQFAGNGNGQYFFNLTLSGITYDGEPLEDATFRVCYYFYGRDASDKAYITLADYVNVYAYEENGGEEVPFTGEAEASEEPVFTWVGDDYEGKPVLCDTLQDDFYITWPEGVDASALTAEDVNVVLTGTYGDELILRPGVDYNVYTEGSVTQVALPFVHMAFVPVYTDLAIQVDAEKLSGAIFSEDALTASYEVASVYTYQCQHGGLNPHGAVLSYQFFGFDEESLKDWSQILHPMSYALFEEDEEGNRLYYQEETASMVEDLAEATLYDATGPEDLNIHLWNQSVVYDTTSCIELEDGSLVYRSEVKTVDGEEKELNKVVVEGWDGNDLRAVQYSPSEARANGLLPGKGYAFPKTDDFFEKYEKYVFGHDYWVAHSMWPWVQGIEKGWLTDPSDGKANWNGLEKGFDFEYAGDGTYPDWTAPDSEGKDVWFPWMREHYPEGMFEAVAAAQSAKYAEQ